MRLQILHLPGTSDQWPFALIVDRYDGPIVNDDYRRLERFAQAIGAKGVLVVSQRDVELEP